MNELNQSIQTIPQATLIASLMLVVIGLILWAAGRRVLKPAFASIALIAGAGVGWAFGSRFDIGVPAFVEAIIAALMFMCFAIIAYRAMVSSGMALVMAIAAPLSVWGGAELRGNPSDIGPSSNEVAFAEQETPAEAEPELTDLMPEVEDIDPWWERGDPETPTAEIDQVDDQTEDDPKDVQNESSSLSDELKSRTNRITRDLALSDETEAHIEKASSYVRAVSDWGMSMWAQTPPVLRPGMIVSAIIGALTGFLVGSIAASFSASIVTSFGGSLLWLTSSAVVARELSLTENLYTELAPGTWLIGWVCLSIIGLAIQWTFRPAKADNVG